MKFSNIKKLTKTANYAVDAPFIFVTKTIREYQRELGLQLCPDFQRGHVWTYKQKVAYIEYLLRGGESGRDIYFNAPFWHSFCVKDDVYNDFVVVDGLQRLTSVLEFMDDKVCIFADERRPDGYSLSQFEDDVPLMVSLRFHINDLKTRAEVLNWYLEMNSGGTPHSAEELQRVAKMYQDEISK